MNETELADYLEMLIRYMQRHHERGYGELLWSLFAEDYPYAAQEMQGFIDLRHPHGRERLGGYQPIDDGSGKTPPGDE